MTHSMLARGSRLNVLNFLTSGTRRKNTMIRVIIPYHLRTLAHVEGEVSLAVDGPVTISTVLGALEARYPMLQGTIRDHDSGKRRPMLRFFACEEDISHEPPEFLLPAAVISGAEPLWIIGAIAGG
jgi:molybdopterin synthase sulfur carrier subunit